MLIERKSFISGLVRSREINVTPEQMQLWLSGVLIQDAMPHLSTSDREFILTGVTDDEWESFAGERDDDDDFDDVPDAAI